MQPTDHSSRPHKCHAMGCETQVRRHFLMCFNHWKMVPMENRRAVFQHYRRKQHRHGEVPLPQWMAAARRAVVYVAIAENKITAESTTLLDFMEGAHWPAEVLKQRIYP